MHPLYEQMVETQRRIDERAWIREEQQLARHAPRPHLLAALGLQLVALGTWLVAHYGSLQMLQPRKASL